MGDKKFVIGITALVVAGMLAMAIIGVRIGTLVGRGQVSCPEINITCPEFKCPRAPEAELVLLGSGDGTLRATEAAEFLNSWLEDEASFTVEVGVDSLTIVKEAEDHLESVMLFAR